MAALQLWPWHLQPNRRLRLASLCGFVFKELTIPRNPFGLLKRLHFVVQPNSATASGPVSCRM
eukprot:12422041-Karenia_brevis.AAC.1